MKFLTLLSLVLFQFSSYSIEAFVKQSPSLVHDNLAESAAIFSGGDYSLTIIHEDIETGHGCTFEGIRISEDLYQDESAKECKVRVISNDNLIHIKIADDANCSSICGLSAELNIEGLIHQARE